MWHIVLTLFVIMYLHRATLCHPDLQRRDTVHRGRVATPSGRGRQVAQRPQCDTLCLYAYGDVVAQGAVFWTQSGRHIAGECPGVSP